MEDVLTPKERALLRRCSGAALQDLDEEQLLALLKDVRRRRRRALEAVHESPELAWRAGQVESALSRVSARLAEVSAGSAAQLLGPDLPAASDGTLGPLNPGRLIDLAGQTAARLRDAVPMLGQRV